MTLEPKPAGEQAKRLTQLLWGPSGEGKTTLACTAPGRKLLCMLDPDGHMSITGRDDVDVIKYYEEDMMQIAKMFKTDDPLQIEKLLKDDKYDTVVVDSLTNATLSALDAGVANPLIKGTAVERPAPGSYQIRNILTLKLIKNMLRVTGKYNKHCIFIGHEDSPTKDQEGHVLFTTIMLGGSLPDSTPIDFSEVWRLWSNTKGKMISIRTSRGYKPMKTRMFSTTGEPEFIWKFNPDTLQGDTIEKWWNEWQKGGKKKLALPK